MECRNNAKQYYVHIIQSYSENVVSPIVNENERISSFVITNKKMFKNQIAWGIR